MGLAKVAKKGQSSGRQNGEQDDYFKLKKNILYQNKS
jgi:hypothetical protein